MSWRDHLEAQKKYIRTKKEALEAKRERERNPRPPRLDPPPAGVNPWLALLVAFLLLLPMITIFLALPNALVPAQTVHEGLVVWILGPEAEYAAIKNWLEPEILANELQWTIAHIENKYDLADSLRIGNGDLLIIEEDFAWELYRAQALAPLLDKIDGTTWENCFTPFWEPRPFYKTYGWAIPVTGSIEDARHLYTIMRQFALPFTI
ncbi:MAG: hypothetical protein QM372_06620 [Bacillota bacterium]|nr:hypothetical protein [Bacillota bacterium]NLJ02643.1 hypothetical protein [Bacillota bacterium]